MPIESEYYRRRGEVALAKMRLKKMVETIELMKKSQEPVSLEDLIRVTELAPQRIKTIVLSSGQIEERTEVIKPADPDRGMPDIIRSYPYYFVRKPIGTPVSHDLNVSANDTFVHFFAARKNTETGEQYNQYELFIPLNLDQYEIMRQADMGEFSLFAYLYPGQNPNSLEMPKTFSPGQYPDKSTHVKGYLSVLGTGVSELLGMSDMPPTLELV